MLNRLEIRVIALVVALGLITICGQSRACLRPTFDERAVQWSSLIVQAKLASVEPIAQFASAATQPSASAGFYQLYDFEVTAVLDGQAKVGDHIKVVRFGVGAKDQESSICAVHLTDKKIGVELLLCLRPEADLTWSKNPDHPDPRGAALHAMKTYAVVNLQSMADLGAEGLAEAKYTISTTRAAEAQFKDDDARLQAQTMITAADDTEESQAEQALMEMGPKALPALNDAMNKASDVALGRLRRVIDSVSPPSILSSIKSD